MKFVFVYPARNLGGVQLLFLRLATLLYNNGHTVGYVDFEDGYVAGEIAKTKLGITVIRHIPGQKVSVPDSSVLILPLSFMGIAFSFISRATKARVIFWCLHPLNIPVQQAAVKIQGKIGGLPYIVFYSLFKPAVNRARASLEAMSASKSICFMDESNLNKVSFFLGCKFEETYLPIFLECSSSPQEFDGARKLAWLGRIDRDSKYFILKKIIYDYLESKRDLPFLVIGDGDGKAALEEEFSDFRNLILFCGEVANDQLTTILDGVGMVFAMGTSCLEAAARYKIVVQVDVFYREVPDIYNYKLFSDVKGYSLGQVLQGDEDCLADGVSFSRLLDQLDSPDANLLAKRSFEKYREKFSAQSFMGHFHRTVGDATLRLEDVPDFRSWFDVVFYKIRGVIFPRKKII